MFTAAKENQRLVIDVSTGEVSIEDFTDQEIADKTEYEKNVAAKLAADTKLETAKRNALSKLIELGLTNDEANLLLL